MIITIAGKAGENRQKVTYESGLLGLENGSFLNSLDLLLQSQARQLYILGTPEALALQKELFGERLVDREPDVVYHLIKQSKTDEVFSLISKIIENACEGEEILIDVTHGFRDHSMIVAYASMVSAFMGKNPIRLVYAKIVGKDLFRYIELNEYMDLTEHTFYLRLFYHTASIGHYRGEDPLLLAMHLFGEDFLANSIHKLTSESYPALKKALLESKETKHFSPLNGLIEKIEEKLKFLDSFEEKLAFEKYLLLSKFAEGMNYSIIALTYLHESISWYLYETLGEEYLSRKEKELSYYNKTQILRKYVGNRKVLDHAFLTAMDEIRDMRNSLAHLSMEYSKSNIIVLKQYINNIEFHYKNDTSIQEQLNQKLKRKSGSKEDEIQLQELRRKIEWHFKLANLKNYSLNHLIPKLLAKNIKASPQIPRRSVPFVIKMMNDHDMRHDIERYAELSGLKKA